MESHEASVQHWDFVRSPASSLLMFDYGVEAGLAPAAVLSGSGLTSEQLHDPRGSVQARQELAIASNLVAQLGDRPGVGIDVGSRYRVGTFGIFGYACITSPTLRQAIGFGLRYYELSFGFCLPSVVIDDSVHLTLQDPGLPPDLSRFLVQRDLASIYGWTLDLVADHFPLDTLDLSFEDDGFDYTATLGVTPRFARPATVASFSAENIDQPLPQSNELAVAAAEEACLSLLTDRRRRTGIAHDVRECLVSASGPPPTMAEVAAQLAVSERTLSRRLADSGTSYRALLAEVQLTLAEQMLATGALSVEDVAIRLGYAEATPFIVAFKRWTGQTPARWQRSR